MEILNKIPFSFFVDVSTTTIKPATTLGRLNAAVITTSEGNAEPFSTYENATDVAEAFGIGSTIAQYAANYFSYTSKTATKPQKLTVVRWFKNSTPETLQGGTIGLIDDIKYAGGFSVTLGTASVTANFTLTAATSLVNAGQIINTALSQPAQPARPEQMSGISGGVITATETVAATADNMTLVVKWSDNTETSSQPITLTTHTFTAAETALNAAFPGADLIFKYDTTTPKLTVTYNVANPTKTITQLETTVTDWLTANKMNTADISVIPYQEAKPEVPAVTYGYCSYNMATGGFDITAFNGGNVSFAAAPTTGRDMSTILKLTQATAAQIIPPTPASTLPQVLADIQKYNGDYVTISYDKSIAFSPAIDFSIIGAWTAGANFRYSFHARATAAEIAAMGTEAWTMIQGYDGLYIDRVMNTSSDMVSAFSQAIVAAIDYLSANSNTNINFIPAPTLTSEAIRTVSEINQNNAWRINSPYVVGGYGQSQTLYGEGNILGTIFNTASIFYGNVFLQSQLEMTGMNIFISTPLIALRGSEGQGLVLSSFSSVLQQCINSGVIITGVQISTTEEEAAITATGNPDIATILKSNGFYIVVEDLTDDDIINKRMRFLLCYVANVPTNRLVIRNFVIGA